MENKKTSGVILKKRYNEAEPKLETVSSLMVTDENSYTTDTANIKDTLKNIYNTANGKINVEYKNNKLKINGINHPVDIGLNIINNFLNKDKQTSFEDIIFNKNSSININGSNIEKYSDPVKATEVIVTMGNVKYYLMPKNITLTTEQLKAVHKLEYTNKTKWPHMLSDVIKDAYDTKVTEYSLMIATLNLADEEIYMSADKILEIALQNGFISLNNE